MASLTAIRDGLRTRVATTNGLREVYARWPRSIATPCALVQPSAPTVLEQTTFDGGFQFNLDIVVVVSLAGGPDAAQALLDPFLDTSGASSIWAVVSADKTLGGTCSSLDVVAVSAYAPLLISDVEYESARWTVAVYV